MTANRRDTDSRISVSPTSAIDRRTLLRMAGIGAGGTLAAGALAGRAGFVPSAAAQDDVTLTVWTPGGTPVFCGMQDDIATDYEGVNPAVKINEIQCGTGGADDFIQVLLGSIAAGNPPDATLLWQTPVALGARGALTPLDDLMAASTYAKAENWPAGLLETCRYQDKTYGLPVTAGIYGIWYNQDLFDSKGIPSDRASFPKTWDELRALSKEFTVWDGDTLVSAGFYPFAAFWGSATDTLPIWSALNGGQLYDATNRRYTIDTPANIAMLEYALAWLDEEYKGDVNLATQSGQSWGVYAGEGGPAAFQTGNLAMTQQGSWVMGDLYAEVEPSFTNWNVAPHPVGPGGTTSVSGSYPNWLVIPDGAAHPTEAFGYLDYLSGIGVSRWYATVPDLPTNLLAPKTVPQVVVDRRGEAFAEEITAYFSEQSQVSTPMWNSPVQDFSNDQLRRVLEQIFLKQVTPAAGLADAQQASQTELDKLLSGQA